MNRDYQLARMILQLSNTIVKNRNKHLKQLDLTAAQSDSVHFFAEHGDATITELKQYLGITHQTARGIVYRMADKGLVQVKRSQTDTRYQIVSLTARGREMEAVLQGNGARTARQITAGMSQEEEQQLYDLVSRALHNVRLE